MLFSLVFAVTDAIAKKPVKPPKPPKPDPDPVVEPNHALAINGYARHTDLYAVDLDGSNPVRVVRRASGFAFPAGAMVWSPDGTRIVWSDLSDKNFQMVNVNGSNRQEILTSTEEMSLSIGGQRNLAPSGFDCDGESANLLYFLGLIKDDPFNPSYAESYEEFYVLDLDDLSSPIRLTNNEFERHTSLEVSPDGQFIATWTYTAGLNWDEPDARLEIRDACEPGLPVVESLSWTAEDLELPDGNLFFARIDWSSMDILAVSGFSDGPGSGDIVEDIHLFDLTLESVKAVKIIGSGMDFGAGVNNRRATWSPDGTQLAFTSDHDVYIYDFLSGLFTQIAWFKLNRDIDWRPTWEANP
ncbi:MAG: hypothetical protein GY732_18380 [Gammaproteobacteria bacterium]|nr:hypothetical protein [Gammaproteobacteria bacterium]